MTQTAEYSHICPLCEASANSLFHTDTQERLRYREYWQCQHCELIFVPTSFHLSHEEEKAIYDFHENDPNDEHYRLFLSPAALMVEKYAKKGGHGLDFGAGPGPALSEMLKESGYSCEIFDPYYHAEQSVWNTQYDFITSTEVFEHLSSPAKVIRKLTEHLHSKEGVLVLMTMLWQEQTEFQKWSYKNDPTHICFFTSKTFEWVARKFGLELLLAKRNLIVLRKLKNE